MQIENVNKVFISMFRSGGSQVTITQGLQELMKSHDVLSVNIQQIYHISLNRIPEIVTCLGRPYMQKSNVHRDDDDGPQGRRACSWGMSLAFPLTPPETQALQALYPGP